MPSGWMPDARHDKRTSWLFAGTRAASTERTSQVRRAERARQTRTGTHPHGPRHAHGAKV